MNTPNDVAYDSVNNRLFVLDRGNNRVTVYNTSSITNGENASYVLAQSNFTSSSGNAGGSGPGQVGISNALGLGIDTIDQYVYVGDRANARVMVYNVAPSTIANGENASWVLGQSSFTTNTAAVTQSGMSAA
jgi:DNA-binding beta-propeller fold protein YncE